jgi:hypothetical protein
VLEVALDQVEDVLAVMKLSRATVRKMKQNLFWAAMYNVVAIPVAAGVLYPSFGVMLRPESGGARDARIKHHRLSAIDQRPAMRLPCTCIRHAAESSWRGRKPSLTCDCVGTNRCWTWAADAAVLWPWSGSLFLAATWVGLDLWTED